MLKRTIREATRKTIMKLMRGWNEIVERYGTWQMTPDDSDEWCKKSEVPRITYFRSVRTFDNFIKYSRIIFSQDFDDYFAWRNNTKDVSTALYVLMKFGMVYEDNMDRRQRQEERRIQMLFAINIYGPDCWEKIFCYFKPAVDNEYPFLEDRLRIEHLSSWAGICRKYFRMWAEDGMDERLIPEYQKIMMCYYKLLFDGGKDMEFKIKDLEKKREELGKDKRTETL